MGRVCENASTHSRGRIKKKDEGSNVSYITVDPRTSTVDVKVAFAPGLDDKWSSGNDRVTRNTYEQARGSQREVEGNRRHVSY